MSLQGEGPLPYLRVPSPKGKVVCGLMAGTGQALSGATCARACPLAALYARSSTRCFQYMQSFSTVPIFLTLHPSPPPPNYAATQAAHLTAAARAGGSTVRLRSAPPV